MKYPKFSTIENLTTENDVEKIMQIISNCVEYVYDKENIYYRKDMSDNEINEFIESLTQKQFAEIQQFFETVPKIKKEVDFKCSKCGYTEKIFVEGIQNFFV